MVSVTCARNPKFHSSWPPPFLCHIDCSLASVSVLQTHSYLAETQRQGEGGCPWRLSAPHARSRCRDEACQGARPEVTLTWHVTQVWSIWGDDKVLLIYAKKKKRGGGGQKRKHGETEKVVEYRQPWHEELRKLMIKTNSFPHNLVRNSFQRKDLKQRANVSKPDRAATLKLCSRIISSHFFKFSECAQ